MIEGSSTTFLTIHSYKIILKFDFVLTRMAFLSDSASWRKCSNSLMIHLKEKENEQFNTIRLICNFSVILNQSAIENSMDVIREKNNWNQNGGRVGVYDNFLFHFFRLLI